MIYRFAVSMPFDNPIIFFCKSPKMESEIREDMQRQSKRRKKQRIP
jgi:hypothetical protein